MEELEAVDALLDLDGRHLEADALAEHRRELVGVEIVAQQMLRDALRDGVLRLLRQRFQEVGGQRLEASRHEQAPIGGETGEDRITKRGFWGLSAGAEELHDDPPRRG